MFLLPEPWEKKKTLLIVSSFSASGNIEVAQDNECVPV